MVELSTLLQHLMEQRGSDLHVKAGVPPRLRVNGRLQPTSLEPLSPADTERLAMAIMPAARAEDFAATHDADFAHSVPGVGRFRVNVFRQRGTVGLVVRRVLPGIPSIEALGLPPVVRRLAEEPSGLVLVTGPTSSGRTTTVAAMVDHINAHAPLHVVTVERPIEVLHADKRGMVTQREVGTDTEGFAQAMRRVLRQDPDVVFLSELPNSATVQGAFAAAETGHLVIAVMTTVGASETVSRLVDFFPPAQQRQARLTLATSLRGVVSQRLLDRTDGRGRALAAEVLVSTPRVFERIVEPQRGETLEELMAGGEFHGMQTLDQSLLELVRSGRVRSQDALAVASNPHDLRIAVESLAGPAEGAPAVPAEAVLAMSAEEARAG